MRLDTNVVIRFLTQDDPVQSPQVNDLFRRAERGEYRLTLGKAVMVESAWVLLKIFRQPRDEVALVLSEMIAAPAVVCEDRPVVEDALRRFASTWLSVVDCLVAAEAVNRCETLATFDAGIAKAFADVEVLVPGAGS